MERTDKVLGVVFLGLGLLLYFWLIPTQVQEGEEGDALSPRFFPNLAALAFIFLGPFMSYLSHKKEKQTAKSNGVDKGAGLSIKNVLHLAICLAVLALNLFLFHIAGFIIAAPITIISFMLLNGGKAGPISMLLTAGGGTAAVYLLAWGVFDIPLP